MTVALGPVIAGATVLASGSAAGAASHDGSSRDSQCAFMTKDQYIAKYGEAAWSKQEAQIKARAASHQKADPGACR
jgi:hypothetical protein